MNVLDNLLGVFPSDALAANVVPNDVAELNAACESILEIAKTENLMHQYAQSRAIDMPIVACESVKEAVTSLVVRELTLEGCNLTLNQVCAGFGSTPEMLGLGTEAETEDVDGKPSRGRALLNKIKSTGKAAATAVGAGWSRVVEGVKSLLGLTMVAEQAFEKIDASATSALAKLNSIQNPNLLAEVQVSGVNVEEFKGAVAHYKSLVATLEKINKAKDGEASQVVNAIYGSLPKLLGIESNGEAELLSAAKSLRGTAKENAVNVKNTTTYAGAEGAKAIKTALTSLQKTAQSMKSTADYRDLVSSLKSMKSGLSPEDAAKLKTITKVLGYYIKASSDVLRSLVKGTDSLLKVAKRFEKLTGSSKSKEVVASTESFKADDLIKQLQAMSAGMESYGYDLNVASLEAGNESIEGYEMLEDGLECVLIALDALDATHTELDRFVDAGVEAAIADQLAMLEVAGAEAGVESEALNFALLAGVSLTVGVEAEEAKKDEKKESLLQKAKGKVRDGWDWIVKKFNEFWTWLSGKSRVFGSLEASLKKLSTWVKNKASDAKESISTFLHKVPGYTALENAVKDLILKIKLKKALIKAFWANPKQYTESMQAAEAFARLLSNEEVNIEMLKAGKIDSLREMYSKDLDITIEGIDGLSSEFAKLKADALKAPGLKTRQKVADLEKVYGGADKIPGLTKIGTAIAKAQASITNHWNTLVRKIAEMIQKVKDYFNKKKEDKKEETK